MLGMFAGCAGAYKFAVFVHPLEGMAAIAVFITPSLRSTMIAEEHQCSMISFGSTSKKIKQCIVIKQEVRWIAMLRADDIWSLNL